MREAHVIEYNGAMVAQSAKKTTKRATKRTPSKKRATTGKTRKASTTRTRQTHRSQPTQSKAKAKTKVKAAPAPTRVDYYPNRMTVAISALAGTLLVLMALIAVLGSHGR